jgi:hypothetical protein
LGEGSPAYSTAPGRVRTYPPRFASPRGVRPDQGSSRRSLMTRNDFRVCLKSTPNRAERQKNRSKAADLWPHGGACGGQMHPAAGVGGVGTPMGPPKPSRRAHRIRIVCELFRAAGPNRDRAVTDRSKSCIGRNPRRNIERDDLAWSRLRKDELALDRMECSRGVWYALNEVGRNLQGSPSWLCKRKLAAGVGADGCTASNSRCHTVSAERAT